jgi:RNA polymerase sigma factor (sigma-70 family)
MHPTATPAKIMNTGTDDLLPTRRSLISRLRNHEDEQSWREFFNTYWKLIYSFAIKCGCTDSEAEEVVQEAIIAFSRKMPEYRYDPAVCSFKGWLLHITNWRIIDQLRKRRAGRMVSISADQEFESMIENIADGGLPAPEILWEQEWEKNILNAAIEKVKQKVRPDHYQVFQLHVMKEEPLEKVAELLGISRAQVYLVKHRVSALVQKEIKALEKRFL